MPDLHVRLVPPKVWQPEIAQAIDILPPALARIARSVLMTMQNQHVGITPALAASLAPLLFDPNAQHQAESPWRDIFERLMAELASDESKSPAAERRQHFGLLLSAAPTYSLIRLATPIVKFACEQLGQCELICADEIVNNSTSASYAHYNQRLAQQIARLARSQDEQRALFWREQALALSSFSRQPSLLNAASTDELTARAKTLPAIDPTALGLLLRLDPDLPPSRRQSQPLQDVSTRARQQRSYRQKEEGIDGIRLTRRIEDIDSIRLSEFTQPKIILAERLINSGFLATQRQPKRAKLQDLLIVALMPGVLRGTLRGDFIKACWFNTLLRLSPLLRQHRLRQSLFRWVEGDQLDRIRTCTFPLQALPIYEAPPDAEISETYRQTFLTALRWLPIFLDNQAYFLPLSVEASLPDDDEAANELTSTLRWVQAAWVAQQQRHEAYPSADRFAFVHIMLCLPAEWRQQNDVRMTSATLLGQLFGRLKLSQTAGRNLSLIWIPKRIDSWRNWYFAARGNAETPLFPNEPMTLTDHTLAGQLVQTWLDHLIKEIWRA